MPTAEARLATERASRYLVQLCSHLDQMAHMGHRPRLGHGGSGTPPAVQQVEWTETRGIIGFPDGRWTLEASPGSLVLRVEADDEEALERLQAGIAARIEKIGRRDGLTPSWRRTEGRVTHTSGAPHSHACDTTRSGPPPTGSCVVTSAGECP